MWYLYVWSCSQVLEKNNEKFYYYGDTALFDATQSEHKGWYAIKPKQPTNQSEHILVWFDGISAIVYLMPNPVFTYILNIWFVNTFCRYTKLNCSKYCYVLLMIQLNSNHLSRYS